MSNETNNTSGIISKVWSFCNTLRDDGVKSSEGLNEGLSEGLREGLKTVLMSIEEFPGIKAKDISQKLNDRPIKTIERQIIQLIKLGFIERKGSRKTGGYYIIGNMKGQL